MKNYARNVLAWILVPLAFLVTFAGVAAAQSAAGGEEATLLDLARPVAEALLSGNPGLAAALALVLAAAIARRYLAPKVPFFASDVGGALLVLVGSFGGAAAAAITGGASWSLALAWTALKIATAAAGGYSLAKPLILWAAEKSPSWLKPVFALVLWVFEKGSPVAKAEAAGAAAVAANPAPGAESITGPHRDVP